MRILITGNLGYVGPVVVRHLRQSFPSSRIEGFDSGFFAHCLTNVLKLPEVELDHQHFGDVRDISEAIVQGADAVVHLAAISNDPMGNRFEQVTDAINHRSSCRLAEIAQRVGVRNYVFASSCSVYGAASSAPRREGDELNPLTAYARSKIATEIGLRQGDSGQMTTTCLRFATACGMSDRLRLDLVLNDFVAAALSTGTIKVLSDGTPWRPLIAVKDMARAIEWAIVRRPEVGGRFLIVNAGSDEWNYQVTELARCVAEILPGTETSINESAPPDKRSYKVDFALYKSLAPKYMPQETLPATITALRDGLGGMNLTPDFRNSSCVRLKVLESHLASGRLTEGLRWSSCASRT